MSHLRTACRVPRWTLIPVMMVALSACCSTLGYFPEQVPTADVCRAPTYGEVRKWALEVADGYDTRHTLNRYSFYGGAGIAAAAAGAMTGLAAFAPGSSAIIGIPIGTTFLSGSMAIYSSEPKALIYDRGSRAIKDLVTLSDCRLQARQRQEVVVSDCIAAPCKVGTTCQLMSCQEASEATCLQRDINGVMRRVSELISYLDPKNVTDTLKSVATSTEANKAAAAQATLAVTKLNEAVGIAQKTVDDATTAAADGADESKRTDLAKAQATLGQLQQKLKTAQKSETSLKEAAAASDSLLTQTIRAALLDSTSLENVTTTCGIPLSCIATIDIAHTPN